jgi:hypothetical protein
LENRVGRRNASHTCGSPLSARGPIHATWKTRRKKKTNAATAESLAEDDNKNRAARTAHNGLLRAQLQKQKTHRPECRFLPARENGKVCFAAMRKVCEASSAGEHQPRDDSGPFAETFSFTAHILSNELLMRIALVYKKCVLAIEDNFTFLYSELFVISRPAFFRVVSCIRIFGIQLFCTVEAGTAPNP